MNSIDIYKSISWGHLLVKTKRDIERSIRKGPRDVRRLSDLPRQDCEDKRDVEVLFQLLRYELVPLQPDGYYHGWKTSIERQCKGLMYECKDETCQHKHYYYKKRGIPCLGFLVKKDSTTSIFIEELLSNPKLDVVVWNSLDGSLYKSPKFKHRDFTTWITFESNYHGWEHMSGSSPEFEITLNDHDIEDLGFDVFICQMAMAMNWEVYSATEDEEFDNEIDKFNIADEVVSMLNKVGIQSIDLE